MEARTCNWYSNFCIYLVSFPPIFAVDSEFFLFHFETVKQLSIKRNPLFRIQILWNYVWFQDKWFNSRQSTTIVFLQRATWHWRFLPFLLFGFEILSIAESKCFVFERKRNFDLWPLGIFNIYHKHLAPRLG